MIQGIGTDIIEIKRIEEAFNKHGGAFFERLFTENECAYCDKHTYFIPHYAGIFAAKEAIVKALGTGFTAEVHWKDIEILNDAQGKPRVHFLGALKKKHGSCELLVSISHCKEYATATAILLSLLH